ncbi:MAG: Di-/tripeptide transporter [Verrucomicrobia subdivision 3 bacterium]|nr:Di-/tripeptide transporter [Limisphaerales bacterium]MCS1413426.1 Di-/tripeptide transporter [Limisphaerales bacterium]
MFGHPKGLRTLFFTELWERLSFYGMRSILVLFLIAEMETGGFGMTYKTASSIYGLYGAMVYLLGLPGGWVADRILGLRKSVFLGGIIIACGHFSMAVPTQPTFYLGLGLIVIGTGLLKPNVSALVGEMYPEGDKRRDTGFSIYYMGINLGALIGPIICGFLGQEVNWHLAFSVAGIGMIIGLIQYRMGYGNLGAAGETIKADAAERSRAIRQLLFSVGGVALIAAVFGCLHLTGVIRLTIPGIAQGLVIFIAVVVIFYFLFLLGAERRSGEEKRRIGGIFILVLASAMFWAGFEQAGTSMTFFAERLTNLSVMGLEFPSSWFQSVNPFFIIILAPVFAWLWVWLKHREPSIPVKLGLALLLLAAAFLVLGWGATYASDATKVSSAWLIITYFLLTCGELCLSPVGLSNVTRLAPKALVGQMMGMWFAGGALGNLIAGLSGGLFESLPLHQLFWSVALAGGIFGVLLVAFKGPIKRLYSAK